MVLGMDISHHNSESNVKKMLEQQETSFIIMKATEGRSFVDNVFHSRMNKYLEETNGEKVVLGAYHFVRCELGNTPEAEAANFINAVMPYIKRDRAMLLGADIEGRALNSSYRKWYEIFLDIVYQATGIYPLVYVSESGIGLLPMNIRKNYGLWVAKWSDSNQVAAMPEGGYGIISQANPNPYPWSAWAIWQYKVNRDLNIDLDIFNGNFAQLKKYGYTSLPLEDEEISEENSCSCGCSCCGEGIKNGTVK